MRVLSLALLGLVALLAGAKPARAAESYDNCTGYITSLPAVISTQGTWCLKQDLSTAMTSGDAITIATNNVTLDCNDFKLGGLVAGVGTQTIGIYALNRLNATVRHCNIRGFYYGLLLQGSSGGGHAAEDNRFDGNTYTALQVEGDGSVVRRNRVFDTSGSTVSPNAYGIITNYSVDILDNTVSGSLASGTGLAFGIYTLGNLSGSISGNRLREMMVTGSGQALGIYNANNDRIILRNNDLSGNANGGPFGAIPLACSSANGSARDNVINGFGTANYGGCSNDGGNVLRP